MSKQAKVQLEKRPKNWLPFIVGFLILLSIVYGLKKTLPKKHSSPKQLTVAATLPTLTPLPTSVATATPLPPTPIPTVGVDTSPVNNTPIPGGLRGQITCNYEIPATQTTYGTETIATNWNNLVPGKNGSAKAALCVTTTGNNTALMTSSSEENGSMTNTAPWIAFNADYKFSLYDDHGGDLPDCGGVVLASCEFNTISPTPSQ